LNVWIATSDVLGHPLAFVKTSSVNETKEIHSIEGSSFKMLKYDQQHRYTFVPNMKAGDMLVFKGSDFFHGSLNLVEHQGLRKSLATLVLFDKSVFYHTNQTKHVHSGHISLQPIKTSY
jgi:hypothetical protein